MELTNIKDAAIYCGTYGKYNGGSIAGKWMKLADYPDKESFYEACRELHKDEADPEFMFQDWEYIPDCYVGESWVSEKVWELMEFDDDDLEMIGAYMDAKGDSTLEDADPSDILEEARDCLVGYYECAVDMAMEFYENSIHEELPSILKNHIDWEGVARDKMYDMCWSHGFYFFNQ